IGDQREQRWAEAPPPPPPPAPAAKDGLGTIRMVARPAARAKVRIMALFLSMACFGLRQIRNYISIVSHNWRAESRISPCDAKLKPLNMTPGWRQTRRDQARAWRGHATRSDSAQCPCGSALHSGGWLAGCRAAQSACRR